MSIPSQKRTFVHARKLSVEVEKRMRLKQQFVHVIELCHPEEVIERVLDKEVKRYGKEIPDA